MLSNFELCKCKILKTLNQVLYTNLYDLLSPEDRDMHRFVWWADQTSPLTDYQMTRVTFGVAASPFAAVQSLQQTAEDFGQELPLAKHHVLHSFYVDDVLAGAKTPQEAAQLALDLRSLFTKGGFDLRKWQFCSTQVMDAIPANLHEPSQIKDISDIDAHQKALGMHWDANNDYL